MDSDGQPFQGMPSEFSYRVKALLFREMGGEGVLSKSHGGMVWERCASLPGNQAKQRVDAAYSPTRSLALDLDRRMSRVVEQNRDGATG